MSARQCPNCMTRVATGRIVVFTDDLICPGCKRSLEVSGLSRNLAAFAGLAAGAIAWRITSVHYSHKSDGAGWILSILYSYLALSAVSPLLLMLIADLRLKSEAATPHGETSSVLHSSQ